MLPGPKGIDFVIEYRYNVKRRRFSVSAFSRDIGTDGYRFESFRVVSCRDVSPRIASYRMLSYHEGLNLLQRLKERPSDREPPKKKTRNKQKKEKINFYSCRLFLQEYLRKCMT